MRKEKRERERERERERAQKENLIKMLESTEKNFTRKLKSEISSRQC